MGFVNLELVAKVLGWVFVLGPVAAVTTVSFHLIMGAAKDDDMIKGFVYLGYSLVLLGAGMLALAYFTDLFQRV